jgi:signal transduction histidine kinase
MGRRLTVPFRLLWRAVAFPWRLQRRKISVQLIYSQVLVVLLTILLIEAVAIAIALGLWAIGVIDDEGVDYTVAQRAQTISASVGVQEFGRQLADGGSISDDARNDITTQLDRIVAGTFPPEDPVMAPENLERDQPNIANIIIIDRTGTVVVTTDPDWVTVGEPYGAIDNALVRQLTGRTLELSGASTAFGNQYVQDVSDRTTVASNPIIVDDEVVGVVTIQGVQAPRASISDILQPSTLTGFAITNGIILGVLSVPALLVSIPVGVWRARKISQRVKDLADAADAMAVGDLSKRVDVRGEDEISRVSVRFNDMIERLQQTDAARKAFVANVSHELRTPVAIIQGNLEQLLNRQANNGLGDEDCRRLRLLYQESLTLSRLIDDLFTVARIEEAQLPLETLPLRIDEVVNQVVDGVKGVAWEQRRVSVESLVKPGLPTVIGDQTRIRQVLGNLLYNGLRHTPEGGLIVVNAQPDLSAGMVEVSVSDTGVGLTDAQLTKVFDRFYQAERTGRHAEGSGLGLAIVKQLVEAQGGSVAVTSIPGEGTTFSFTLPIAQ